jgi:hypothetical protein
MDEIRVSAHFHDRFLQLISRCKSAHHQSRIFEAALIPILHTLAPDLSFV